MRIDAIDRGGPVARDMISLNNTCRHKREADAERRWQLAGLFTLAMVWLSRGRAIFALTLQG